MFNPSRLTAARKRRGWTKKRLSDKAILSVRSISLYENGHQQPTDETISSLARALTFPVAFFHGPDLEEPSVNGASFRALASMTAGQRDMALSAGSLAVEIQRWIDERFTLPEPSVPDLRSFDPPEAAAHALRSHWGVGEKTIENMVHLLEAHGVRVFSLPRDSEAVNAFSFWHRSDPYVFLTTDMSGERGRFDAAHELGHLALHRQGGPRSREAEIEADKFASAFLMPRASVLAVAPRAPTIRTLVQLKRRWKVSLAALVQRLHAVGMLSEWQHRTLCIEISQRGFRKKEPAGFPRESSQVLAKVFASLRGEGVSRSQIAKDLLIHTHDLDALVFGLVPTAVSGGGQAEGAPQGGRPKLRLV